MRYKIRPGTILTRICDEYLIIAGREARDFCPSAIQINETGAYIWKLIEKGLDTNEIMLEILTEYDSDEKVNISQLLNDYVIALQENGYLLEEGY